MAFPIKVGLIGTGLSTRVFHAPFILSLPGEFALHAIVERKATSSQSVARDLYGGSVKVYNTVEELVTAKEVELLIVNSPNDTHYPYAKLALDNGIHAAVEKPLCATSTEATELCTLAASKGLILAPFQNRRWDSDFLTLKKLFDAGTFGDVSDFTTTFDRFKPAIKGNGNWKELASPSSGQMFDLGSHLIDQVLVLFGTPAALTAVAYNARNQGDPSIDDTFIIWLHYRPSATRTVPLIVTVRTTMISPVHPQLRYEMRGNRGSFVKRGADPQEDQLKADPNALNSPSYGVEDPSIAGSLTVVTPEHTLESSRVQSEKGNYQGWFRSVAAAIRGGGVEALGVKPLEGAEVIRTIELAKASARLGKTVEWGLGAPQAV